MKRFVRLFETARIGSFEVKNRIVLAPAVLGYAGKDGTLTEQLIDYYAERAIGLR